MLTVAASPGACSTTRAVAEDVGVELGGLVGVAVAPDGGSDELSHVDTVA